MSSGRGRRKRRSLAAELSVRRTSRSIAPMRALLLVLLAAAPACMVAQFEEVPSDRRQLRNGLEVLLLWPDQELAGSATVSVAYISARPDQLEAEAQEVWAEIRADVEKKGIGRVALRPTVFERGFKWHNGRPSFWRTSTTTFWRGRTATGGWSDGDPGVDGQASVAER
jgi:hypothetical protein